MAAQRRRTAWTSPQELNVVFTSLFHSDGDAGAQRWAIARIKVWLARGPNCPHAAESTASLLEIVLRDTEAVGSSNRPSQQELRLAYSMALIRFVNSLVDPLQTTYFARGMASLAAQLGLPLWFVELRHAATHEDLPGLSVLRDASRQALDWLYSHYWLPTVSPNSIETPLHSLEPLQALLNSYKTLTKTYLRDASKVSRTKTELLKVYRSVEAWVIEAESLGRGRDRAIDGLAEAFLMIGGLVPTAKKKRPSARSPDLSKELRAIWTPILARMSDAYETFMDVLLARAVELLAEPESPGEGQEANDPSYALTLTAWVIHFLQAADDPLVTEGVVKTCLLTPSQGTLALLDALVKADASLADTVRPLVNVLRNSDSGLTASLTADVASAKLDEMEKRLREFEAQLQGEDSGTKPLPTRATGTAGHHLTTANAHWKEVADWKPCPIGSLPSGGFKSLDLPPRIIEP
ncbi:ribosomal biogenesis protein LAS1, partial [Phenoliferia sp. Uapishka_3]